eukprot:159400-Chlamydomonas_euryale.AAC.1
MDCHSHIGPTLFLPTSFTLSLLLCGAEHTARTTLHLSACPLHKGLVSGSGRRGQGPGFRV